MANTYSGNPASSDLDWVRFRLQDVAATWKFTDEEINAYVTEKGDKRIAAATLCEVLAARYANQADYTNAALSEQASQKAQAWLAMAETIRQEPSVNAAALGVPRVMIGGQSAAERVNRAQDSSLTQPDFVQGMLDGENTVQVVPVPNRLWR